LLRRTENVYALLIEQITPALDVVHRAFVSSSPGVVHWVVVHVAMRLRREVSRGRSDVAVLAEEQIGASSSCNNGCATANAYASNCTAR